MKLYKYGNENIYAEDRWTAWVMAREIFQVDNVVLHR